MKHICGFNFVFNPAMHDAAVHAIGRTLGVYIRASACSRSAVTNAFLNHTYLPIVYDADIPAYRVEFRDASNGAILLYIDGLANTGWEVHDASPRQQ
jgi:hypothetical protein